LRALAQRYASALADVGLEQGTAPQVKAELAAFAALLTESADLQNFLASPAIARESKQGVIEKLVARLGAGRTLRNLLFVLVENRRTALLPQIREAFEATLYARMGVAEAQVTSVTELSAAQKADLNRVLERLTGQRVEARYAVDPALLGGAVVRIGSTIYDGSVREQLNRLRATLTSE
jgi:F-type H+-transporting ATPase subunit delta